MGINFLGGVEIVIEVTHLSFTPFTVDKSSELLAISSLLVYAQIVLQVRFQDENNSWGNRGFFRANFYLHKHNTESAFIGIGQKVRWTYPSIVTLDPYDAIQRHWS